MTRPNETSLKDKVRVISKAQGRPFNIVWRGLVLERFLARVSGSSYRDQFIFKGGMLLAKYVTLGRETADLDFLLKGLSADKDKITKVINEICVVDANDCFEFRASRIEVVDHLLSKYPGYELALDVACGKSKTRVSIDIGVGGWAEVISKEIGPISTEKGPIFGPGISLMVYPVEMIFAEKLQTACIRGASNSRMKDYHDLFVICRANNKIEAEKAEHYIVGVFSDRETPISLIPLFSGEDLDKLETMWRRHHSALTPEVRDQLPESIATVIKTINAWLRKNLRLELSSKA